MRCLAKLELSEQEDDGLMSEAWLMWSETRMKAGRQVEVTVVELEWERRARLAGDVIKKPKSKKAELDRIRCTYTPTHTCTKLTELSISFSLQ